MQEKVDLTLDMLELTNQKRNKANPTKLGDELGYELATYTTYILVESSI